MLIEDDIQETLNNFKKWLKRKTVNTSLLMFPGKTQIQLEPYGVTLVMGSWNYPFYTLLNYLASAIAAGNVVVVKPSEISSESEKVTERIL